MFGRRMVEVSTDPAGMVEVELRGHSEEMVARQLAGLAGKVEVRSPIRLRRRLADIGYALIAHYGDPTDDPGPSDDAEPWADSGASAGARDG